MATIGADPELFIRDERTGGVLSVVGLIGGTKEKPLPMEGLADGFAVQEDNVMLEFNIPPANVASRFSRDIQTALDYAGKLVRTRLSYAEFDYGQCSRLFVHSLLETPQARVFGCSTDYNAHTQGQSVSPLNPDDLLDDIGAWRFSGGHVHLGYTSSMPPYVVAAFCDVYLGLPSVALDKQGKRRALYGTAGRYRPTDWGIEYRPLSNFWIWDEKLRLEVAVRTFNLLARVERGEDEHLQKLYAEIPWIDVVDAINTENEIKAADLLTYCSRDLKMGDV